MAIHSPVEVDNEGGLSTEVGEMDDEGCDNVDFIAELDTDCAVPREVEGDDGLMRGVFEVDGEGGLAEEVPEVGGLTREIAEVDGEGTLTKEVAEVDDDGGLIREVAEVDGEGGLT